MGGCAAAARAGGPTAFVLHINASHFVQQHTFDCCLAHFVHLTFGRFVQILCFSHVVQRIKFASYVRGSWPVVCLCALPQCSFFCFHFVHNCTTDACTSPSYRCPPTRPLLPPVLTNAIFCELPPLYFATYTYGICDM